MSMVVTRQERHFEPSVRRVLTTDKEPNAESANRESPSCGIVAAPMADEPSENEGDQPNATNPDKIMPHRRIYDFALGASSRGRKYFRTNSPSRGGSGVSQTRHAISASMVSGPASALTTS
jgi:hypothetical protein